MKHFLSILLILSIFSFQFSDVLVYLSFKLHQDYIVKNTCIEKDVENSTCKGCCQLKKKLASNKKQKEQLPPTQNTKQNVDLFSQKIVKIVLFPFLTKKVKQVLSEHYNFYILLRIFHPPRKKS